MADPLTPIINQLANLVSLKSALRLLLIACGIIICWINLQPYLEEYNLPSELAITLITIVGFSLGALTSIIIFTICELINTQVANYFRNKKEKKEQDKKSELLEIQKTERMNVFKKSFEEYSNDAKVILLDLSINDKAIKITEWEESPTNIAFKGLHENKIITILERIDKRTFFCTINPFFKGIIIEYFKHKHKEDIENITSGELQGFNLIIELFKKKEKEEMHVFDIGIDIYSERYLLTPVIKHEEYEPGEIGENCNIQFYIEDHYHDILEENTGSELRYFILANFNDLRPVTNIHQ